MTTWYTERFWTINQILVRYVTITIEQPNGETRRMRLSDAVRSENITKDFADEIISKLSEKEIDGLKRIAVEDYQLRGEGLIFVD